MKIKIFLGLLFYLFTFFKLSAEEIKILSDNIKVLENGKIIKSVRSPTIKKMINYIQQVQHL